MQPKNKPERNEHASRIPTSKHGLKRVSNLRLLEADMQSKRIPVAADRAIEQLEALLHRAKVLPRRGYKEELPPFSISMLQEQALQECIVLLKLKVALQRGIEVKRTRDN